MGILAMAIVVIVVLWLLSRLIDKQKAGRLRDRQDAKKVGRMTEGVGTALPFLGASSLELPPPPPSVEIEPDLGDHQIRIDAPAPVYRPEDD